MKVSFSDLDEAFVFANMPGTYWIDKKTGKVQVIVEETAMSIDNENYIPDPDDREAIRRILILIGERDSDEPWDEADDDRFIEIIPADSRENWEIMRRFASTVEDSELQDELEDALNGRKPFRSFKNVLQSDLEEEVRWYLFEADARREQILKWAASENIEVDFTKKY